MKLLSFAAIVAGAGIVQVLAVPLLVLPKENPPAVIRVHFVSNQVEKWWTKDEERSLPRQSPQPESSGNLQPFQGSSWLATH